MHICELKRKRHIVFRISSILCVPLLKYMYIFFLQFFSIQDNLECVGRLQDHADVLEDVKKDLLRQTPMADSMEGLQIQIEECQVRL